MKCPNCQREVNDGQNFCQYCGMKLPKNDHGGMDEQTKKKLFIPLSIGVLCIFWIVVLGLILMPKQTTADKLQEKLDLGNNYLEKADYVKAQAAFQDALSIDEKSPEADLGMADVYAAQKNPDQSLKYLRKASDDLETASRNKNPVSLPRDPQKFKDHYQHSCKDTSNLYGNNGNSDEQKALRDLSKFIADFDIPVITNTPAPKPHKKKPTPKPETKTPTPTPDDGLDEGNAGKTGNTLTVTPTETITPTPTETVTPVPDDPEPEPNTDPNDPDNPSDAITPVPDNPSDLITPVPDNPSDSITPIPENPPEPVDNPEPIDNPEPVNADPEELLNTYMQETIEVQQPQASFSGTSTDAFSASSVMNGRAGTEKVDLDKDGIPELLVISVQGGHLSFSIYKVVDNTVQQTANVTAVCDGMGTPLTDMTYGSTQECFIRDNGGSYMIGFASYLYGADAGDGTPAARTSLEAYQIDGDGSASRLCAATIQNGDAVYSDGNATTAQSGGQDLFAGMLGAAGLSGSWNAENAGSLVSMDLANDPWQDMSWLPDPLSGGLNEAGAEDLVVVSADMGAGTGTMSLGLQDNTFF